MEYDEEDFLQLSGLQHYMFCKRQWALIHVEGQWQDNVLTAEGALMHERAHDSGHNIRRNDIMQRNALRVRSYRLGLSGECDVVEFHKSDKGISLLGEEGRWILYPIEYKHGKSKTDDSDRAQLCAQALCLEEMYCCAINEGALYYGKTHRREKVEFTEELRNKVVKAVTEMHELSMRMHTPKVKIKKGCTSCSLYNICVPFEEKQISVNEYLNAALRSTK